MWTAWLPLVLWGCPALCAGGDLDGGLGPPESKERLVLAASPEAGELASSAAVFREEGGDGDDPRFALFLRVTVFGELGDVAGSPEAWGAAALRAEKLVFTTVTRSLFVGATGDRPGFQIKEKPDVKSYVTPPFQLDEKRPGGKGYDLPSPFPRTHFEFTFSRLTSAMANALSKSMCKDYEREEQEVINSILRALDASNSYPSDMISLAARLLTGMDSVIHFMAGTIDTSMVNDCPRDVKFKSTHLEGCLLEGGCYWDARPTAPRPDEENQMNAFHTPPCPHGTELDETGKACRCNQDGWEGLFELVVSDGGQYTRPFFQSAGSETECARIDGYCETSPAGTQMMVLDDGSPAKGHVDERAHVKCSTGYTPSEQATCGWDGRWSPEPGCAFVESVAPPEPVCEVGPLQETGSGYVTDGCEDCVGTSGEPWAEECSCDVRCKDGFKSTGGAGEGEKACQAVEFDCTESAKTKCAGSADDEISSWCCDQAWGSTLPPEKLTSQTSCTDLEDHRSCLRARDKSDGAPCCWRHEGFGDESGAPKCLPMSNDDLLDGDADFKPTGGCAVERSVLAASWEPLPTCTRKCDPILPVDGLLPTDCDDCVPGDCRCTVRCADGFVRFGGGLEHEVRDCQGYNMTPVVPTCFKTPDGTTPDGLFTDPRRGECEEVGSSDRLRVVEGCKDCKAGGENCYCKAECPERTRWIGGGEENAKLGCITKNGPEVEVTIVASCEEIEAMQRCTNSSIMEDGKEVPCCYRRSGFSEDGATVCARQGNPLITQERRPEICTERVESRWEPLPECGLLCDPGPLASAPNVEVSKECGECVADQAQRTGKDCKCKVTCAPGYVRVGGGPVAGTRSCGLDLSYGDAPVCRRPLPGEMTCDTREGGDCGGPDLPTPAPSGVHIPNGVVAPICPPPHLEHATAEGCEGCVAGDPGCECEMWCDYYYSDMEDPAREEAQTCRVDGERELSAENLCTEIEDDEECLSSRDRDLNTTCCWRDGGHAEDGRAQCAPFGWKDMRYAPDRCAQVLKASFRPPKCEPLCILPWAEELEEKHVEMEGCDEQRGDRWKSTCAVGKDCPGCKLTCDGDYEVLAGRVGQASCTTSNRNFTLPTCACPPDKADSCAKELLKCEGLSLLFKLRYGKVEGCGHCDIDDDCKCEIACKDTDKLIGENKPECKKVPSLLANKKACDEITDEEECLKSRDSGTEGELCCFQASESGGQCVAKNEATGQVRCAIGLRGKWTNLPVCKRKCPNVFAKRPGVKHEHCDDCAAGEECSCNVSCAEGWEHYGGTLGPKRCRSSGGFDGDLVCGRPEAPPECSSPGAAGSAYLQSGVRLQMSPEWVLRKTNAECLDGYSQTRDGETLDGCFKACEGYGALAYYEGGRCDCCKSTRVSPHRVGTRPPFADAYERKSPLVSSDCSECIAGGGNCPSCRVSCADDFALVGPRGESGGHPECVADDVGRESSLCESAGVKADCLTAEQDGQPCCWDGTRCLKKGSPLISARPFESGNTSESGSLQCAPMKVAAWRFLPECTPACYNDFQDAEHVVSTNCDKCRPGDDQCPCTVECEQNFAMIGQGTSNRDCSVLPPKMDPAPVCVEMEPLKCPSPEPDLDDWIGKLRGVSWRHGLKIVGCDCTPDQSEPCECTMTCKPDYRLGDGSEGDKTCVVRDATDFLQERSCSSASSQDDCLVSAWNGEQCCWWAGGQEGQQCGLASDSFAEKILAGRLGSPSRCAPLRLAEWEDLPVCQHKCDPAKLALGSRLQAAGCDSCTANQDDCQCYVSCKAGFGDGSGDAVAPVKVSCEGDDQRANWATNDELALLDGKCQSECPALDSQGGTLDLAQCPEGGVLMDGEKCTVNCRSGNNIRRVDGRRGLWGVRCDRDGLDASLKPAVSQFPECLPFCEPPDDQYGQLNRHKCSKACAGGRECNCEVSCKGVKSGGGAEGKKRCRLFPGSDTVDASAAWVDANRELEDRVTFTLKLDVDSDQKEETASKKLPLRAFLLLDGSGSVGAKNWENEKRAAVLITETFQRVYVGGSDGGSLHVGAAEFANTVSNLVPMTDNVAGAISKIKTMKYTKGGTKFIPALKKCQEQLSKYTKAGTQTFDLCVLITDGRPQDKVKTRKDVAKYLDDSTFLFGIFVAVGKKSDQKEGTKIMKTISSEGFFASASDFEELMRRAEEIASNVSKKSDDKWESDLAAQWESVMASAIADALGYSVLPSDVEVSLYWVKSKLEVRVKVYCGANGERVKGVVEGGGLKDPIVAALDRSELPEMTDFGVENVTLLPAEQGWDQFPQCLPPITMEVVSADKNSAISGAVIKLYRDESRTPGTETLTKTTAGTGKAVLAGEGTYFRVTKPKYTTADGILDRSTCRQSQASCFLKVPISPEIPGQEFRPGDCTFVGKAPDNLDFKFRAVLTWKQKPPDLDIWARRLESREWVLYNQASWPRGLSNIFTDKIIQLDVDQRNGFGPETITFADAPPGTYQIVVNTYTSQYKDIREGEPMVTLYFGKTSIPFKCKIADSCSSSSRVWNVVNIVVEKVQYRGETYRIRLRDGRNNMADLDQDDVPTATGASSRYNNAYLKNVCHGVCEPANLGVGLGPGSSYADCVEHDR